MQISLDILPKHSNKNSGWPWTEVSNNAPHLMPNGSDWTRITVVTPSYNQGQFLEETIRSVLLQGYPNLEYIIIDGGSTDNSVEIIKRYEQWLTFWISEADDGQSHAINRGFAKGTGELFAWLNSDDIYLPNTLHTIARAYQQVDTTTGAIVGYGVKVDLFGNIIYEPKKADLTFDTILDWYQNHFMQPGCFFTKVAWQQCGPLREDLEYCMDVDLWLKIAKQFSFHRIPHICAHATVHGSAKTTNKRTLYYTRIETDILLVQYG
jgi:hypothetical protein